MNKTALIIATGLLLSACASPDTRQALLNEAHYWQRAAATESVMMDGPKTQQMLHRDIARCTTELSELEHLGTITHALPQKTRYRDPQADKGKISRWNAPSHDGYLIAEQGLYYDFESCMVSKGWARAEYVPYDSATKNRQNYLDTIIHQRYQSRIGDREAPFTRQRGPQDPSPSLNR